MAKNVVLKDRDGNELNILEKEPVITTINFNDNNWFIEELNEYNAYNDNNKSDILIIDFSNISSGAYSNGIQLANVNNCKILFKNIANYFDNNANFDTIQILYGDFNGVNCLDFNFMPDDVSNVELCLIPDKEGLLEGKNSYYIDIKRTNNIQYWIGKPINIW